MEKALKLSVLGGGSWGTALTLALAPRFASIRLWVFEKDLAERLQTTRENDVYLPGFQLPAHVEITTDIAHAVPGADFVLCVIPSAFARRTYAEMLPRVSPSTIFVSATKGLEHNSLLRMSQVLFDVVRTPHIAILSGPTFAREVARGEPAAVVVSSEDRVVANKIQQAFSGPNLRLYTNADPVGVEMGGALKNVIAIAAGVVEGLGMGNNTMAALITRGLAEITRLAAEMGGRPETLAGLAGLGDLVLTCTGDLSRNRRVGVELAKGKTLRAITASTPMVAEGVETCASAVALGRKYHVDLPIMEQMHAVLHKDKSPREAIRDLMERTLRSE